MTVLEEVQGIAKASQAADSAASAEQMRLRQERWVQIREANQQMLSAERQLRDVQAFQLESGNPVVVPFQLDDDLAQLYAHIAGPRYQLTPTDILLIQVIRFFRLTDTTKGDDGPKPTEPDGPVVSEPAATPGVPVG